MTTREEPREPVRNTPGRIVDLIRGVLDDPRGEEALNLALFLIQDPMYQGQVQGALDQLRRENPEAVDAFESESLVPAQEFVESGVIDDAPGMIGPGGTNTEFNLGASIEAGLTAAGIVVPGAGIARLGGKALMSALRAARAASKMRFVRGGALLATGAAVGMGFQGDADPQTGSDHNAGAADPQASPEQGPQAFVLNPNTGNYEAVNPAELGPEFTTGIDPEAFGAEGSFAPGSATEFADQAIANVSGGGSGGIMGALDPRQLGRVTLNEPFMIPGNISRMTSGSGGPLMGDPLRPGPGQRALSTATQVPSGRGRTSRVLDPLEVPAGAEISPRAMGQFAGRSLLEWARIYAARYNVPFNILYGLVDYESGWDPNAVGDNGTSFGLVQIHRPAFPDITRTEALDPRFALDFAASMLRERYDRYGRWDAAVAAHNSPVAADYLAKTGQFYTAKSSSYVNEVMSRSNNSGLASSVYSSEEFPDTSDYLTSIGGGQAVFPVQGAQMPKASHIGLPRDGGTRQHQGLDIMAEEGTPVVSATGGRVRYASDRGGKGGFAVSIEDAAGNWHYYAHMSPQSGSLWASQGITEGAMVNPGTIIGYVGTTGNAAGNSPHLHYSINEGRKDAPLIDPFDFLRGSNMAAPPEFNPFSAPDVDVSRDFIRGLYADLFGRDPTDEEYGTGQERLTALARQQYNTDIQQARGLPGTDMDINTTFQNELMETGEYAFTQERTGLRSFTDWAANIASLLQQGL